MIKKPEIMKLSAKDIIEIIQESEKAGATRIAFNGLEISFPFRKPKTELRESKPLAGEETDEKCEACGTYKVISSNGGAYCKPCYWHRKNNDFKNTSRYRGTL